MQNQVNIFMVAIYYQLEVHGYNLNLILKIYYQFVLKDKEKCHQKHGKKEQQGSRTSEDLFCTFPVFLSECDCSKGGTASACKSGECGDDGDNRKCDADTGKR